MAQFIDPFTGVIPNRPLSDGELVRTLRMVPEKFFKHLEGAEGLFEIRIKIGSDIFRILCFFDEGNLIILLNGFQKKSQKTPKLEISLASRLKTEYYKEKIKGKL